MIRTSEPVLKRLHTAGHLTVRPSLPTTASAPRGLHPLKLERRRDGFIYVPPTYQPERATPLVLMLHGTGGDAEAALQLLEGLADRYGLLLLAIASRDVTWDLIRRNFGPDIATIDQALAYTFDRYNVDPRHLAIAGFSDGASYALTVGVMNGHLFTHIMAFSPGFMVPTDRQGQPHCFVSHGISDPVLPISRCSRRIVPELQAAGYDTFYQEFEGGHTVPPAISRDAMDWLTGDRVPTTFAETRGYS